MVGIKLVQFIGLVDMPDLRKLEPLKPDEMRADNGRDPRNAGTFLRPELERFPFQRHIRRDHPSLTGDRRLERHPEGPSEWLPTDEALYDHALEVARTIDAQRRVAKRDAVWQRDEERASQAAVQGEIDRRTAFFAAARQIIEARADAQAKARRLMRAYFEFLREEAQAIAADWKRSTAKLIVEGANERREWLEWRLSQLYLPTTSGAIAQAPGRGVEIEVVAGEMYARQVAELVQRNWKWRKGNAFFEAPNGAIVRDSLGHGLLKDTLLAAQALPEIRARVETFREWHDSNTRIQAPNGALRQGPAGQGDAPELASAKNFAPVTQARTEAHQAYRESGRLQSLPNGGVAPLPGRGQIPETVHADLYWPERDAITQDIATWHAENKLGPTSNGGVTTLRDVGESPERVMADRAQPVRERRTDGHDAAFEANRYIATSNNVIARLEVVGKSAVEASADVADLTKDEALRGLEITHRATDAVREGIELEDKQVSRTYRDTDPSERSESAPVPAEPLPGAGEPQAEAPHTVAQVREQKTKLGLREIQRALAAHEPAVSHLTGHVVKRSS